MLGAIVATVITWAILIAFVIYVGEMRDPNAYWRRWYR